MTKRRVWNVVIILLTCALALATGVASFATASRKTSPEVALDIAPFYGLAYSSSALRLLGLERARENDPFAAPSGQAVALAREAHRREPLDVDALVLIALDRAEGTPNVSLRLLEAARGLSRRSSLASIELVAAYSRRGDDARAIRVLDELLRRRTVAHGELLERLAAAAGEPALRSTMLAMLFARPSWEEEFWGQIAQSPAGLRSAAALRLATLRQNGARFPETDPKLIAGLAGAGRYDEAATLLTALWSDETLTAWALRNGKFGDAPRFLPFDWRLASDGNFGSELDPNEGGLAVSALAGARGIAAEQLVRVDGRPARMTWMAEAQQSDAPTSASFQVDCADTNRPIATAPIAAGVLEVPASRCRWAFVRILLDVPKTARDQDWRIPRVAATTQGL